MKKLFLFALPIILFSCFKSKKGSGHIITETRTVAAFNAVDVSTSIDVELVQGNKNEVVVEADDNIIKDIEVVNKSGVLSISLNHTGSLRKFTARVKVTAPVFANIAASSSSSIKSTNTLTSTDKIKIDANSSADITLDVDAPNVIAECSSSATINLNGKTKQFDATANSSADIKAENLKAETVTASASSSATINVFASVKLKADANSSADINYSGGVKDIQKSVSSSGSVSPQ
jgi:Putative auto-transporter adhesin, head GIN domain